MRSEPKVNSKKWDILSVRWVQSCRELQLAARRWLYWRAIGCYRSESSRCCCMLPSWRRLASSNLTCLLHSFWRKQYVFTLPFWHVYM